MGLLAALTSPPPAPWGVVQGHSSRSGWGWGRLLVRLTAAWGWAHGHGNPLQPPAVVLPGCPLAVRVQAPEA